VINAVLWDFGGVILSSPFEAFNRYEAEIGLPANFIRGMNARSPDTNAWARMERSEVDLDGFAALFEAEALEQGHKLSGHHVLKIISGEVRPEMVEALRRVKKHHRIACITNNMPTGDGPGMARDPERVKEIEKIMGLFEHVIESSKLGIRKPDPRIYLHACQLLGVEPADCVYLDDLGVNLKPAKALGMRTIKVENSVQALGELENILGIPLR
jgi:putative hydrolase of the HAD superfamily